MVNEAGQLDKVMYKTEIIVTVLSEEPIADFHDLKILQDDMNFGFCMGTWEMLPAVELTDKEAIDMVHELGGDPSFFNLSE